MPDRRISQVSPSPATALYAGRRRTALTSVRPALWRSVVGMLLTGVVSGCGASTSTASAPSPVGTESPSAQTDEASPTGQTITMWTFKQSHVSALEAVGEAWQEQSGIGVEVEVFTPDDAYYTRLRAAANTNDLPDILSVHSQGAEWREAQAGILADLTDEFTEDWQSQLYPSAVEATELTQERIDNAGADPSTTLSDLTAGHFYAVPYLAGTPGVVFARKSLLEAAGVDPEVAPGTWEDWIASIQKTIAQDPSSGGVVTGLKVAPTGYFWLYRPMAFQYLGREDFYSRQGADPTLPWDDPKSIETLTLYDQLTPLWTPGVLNLDIDQADQAFAAGEAAWDVGGTFTLPFLEQQGVDPEDILVFAIPAPVGSSISQLTLTAAPLVSAGVTASSTNREEAVDFLRYLTGTEGAALFAEVSGDVPATEFDTQPDDELLASIFALFEGSPDEAFSPNDFSADPGGGSGPIGGATADQLVKLVAGQTTPDQLGTDLASLYADAWAQEAP